MTQADVVKHTVFEGPVKVLTDGVVVVEQGLTRFDKQAFGSKDHFTLVLPNGESHLPTYLRPAASNSVVFSEDDTVKRLANSEVILRIEREIEGPQCPICQRASLVFAADHKHCQWSNEQLPLSYEGAYSEESLAFARNLWLAYQGFPVEVPLAKGKRVLKLHAKTFAENDLAREWQDNLLRKQPNIPNNTYFALESRAHLTLELDDDGTGKAPREQLSEDDKKLSSAQQFLIGMEYFKTYPDTLYRMMLESCRRLDSLVEAVCSVIPNDHYNEEQLLELADDILLGQDFVSPVKVFNGDWEVFYTSSTTKDMDAADDWAAKFIGSLQDDQGGKILALRENEIRSLARLAVEFRGDTRNPMDGPSFSFDDRVEYLMNLPIAVFHLYLQAANVWRKRTMRALDYQNVGNF